MARLTSWILALLALILVDFGSTTFVSNQEWNTYKMLFNKVYTSAYEESNARYNYGYNNILINNHNALYERGRKTFKLKINQFTDMRLKHFNDRFPVTTPLKLSYATPPPPTGIVPPSYDPVKNSGIRLKIENQGTKCNSGWAYAAVKAIEIAQATQTNNVSPAPLSAQNIIDCAGSSTGCTKQVPQTAYDYLSQYDMDLHLQSEYPNQNTQSEPGMCVPKGTVVTKLNKYSILVNGDDESLRTFVGSGLPVVVEFNPCSFEFMHYAEGIYQQPKTSTSCSHYMVVVGYDTDPITGIDYWILQNSFDNMWGEMGLIRVQRSALTKLTKNAIFPTDIA